MSHKALITGGTRGIGKAIAEKLLADGFLCTITGTRQDSPSSAPIGVTYFPVSFEDRDQVELLFQMAADGDFDILVNNVGINIKGETPAYLATDFDRMVDVNLRAAFRLCQAVLPSMITKSWGRIVNITSLWGVAGHPNNAAYCATKFALDGMTASLAPEVARNGVLVNSVAPGFILTEQAEEAFTPDALADVEKQIPIGRLGKPREVASLVSWLVSEENTYLTGQNILIDGGLTRTSFP